METALKNIEKIRQAGRHLVDPEIAVAIFEFLPDALVVIDSFGKIKLVNKRAEEMFGYTRDEMYDQPGEILIPDDLKEKYLKDLQLFLAEDPLNNPHGLQPPVLLCNKKGDFLPVRIHLNPIPTASGFLIAALVRLDD
jgi:PAS domain S-box-containing protein